MSVNVPGVFNNPLEGFEDGDLVTNGIFEQSLALKYSAILADALATRDVRVVTNVHVNTNVEASSEGFMALMELTGANEAILHYDRDVLEGAALEFDDNIETFGALERIYIFGGITWASLQSSMRASSQESRRFFSERLVDTTILETDIANHEGFSYYEKGYLLTAVREANNDSHLDRLCKIQELRLVIGLFAALCADDIYDLREGAMSNIKNALLNRAMISIVARRTAGIEDPDTLMGKMFADSPSELSIALAFPMSQDELLQILSTVNSDHAKPFSEEVVSELPLEGFHIEPRRNSF